MNEPRKNDQPELTSAQVAAAVRGDTTAWKALYHELLPVVWRYVAARLVSRADVEDVVQEAFLAIVQALPGYREKGRFHGFAFAIVRQRVAAWYRARSRAPEKVPSDLAEMLSSQEAPDEAFARQETRELLRRALLTLCPGQRRALTLKYAQGLRFRDLATEFGLSDAATKSLVIRAKAALRSALGDEIGICPGR